MISSEIRLTIDRNKKSLYFLMYSVNWGYDVDFGAE